MAVLVTTTDNEFGNLMYEKISDDGFIRVTLDTSSNVFYNIISPFGNLLSPTWFEWCCSFKKDENFVEVQRIEDKKCNWRKKDGSFLSSTWFDACDSFHNDFAIVKLGENKNFIDYKGKLLSQEWFTDCENFSKNCEFAIVESAPMENDLNLITKDGKLVSERWFSEICSKDGSIYYVILDNNDFWNIVNNKGNLLQKRWCRFRKKTITLIWGIILLYKDFFISWLKNKFKRI